MTNYDHAQGDPFGLLGLAGAICNGTAPGLAVLPKSGRAVMFYAKEKALPNWQLWHAGCHLLPSADSDQHIARSTAGELGLRGRKVTIQKFKEAAPVVRFSKSLGKGVSEITLNQAETCLLARLYTSLFARIS